MRIFSNVTVNTNRQTEMDLLRGCTAIILIIVHTGLYLGNGISKEFWTFCDLLGSEPGAPVFMVLMGISMIYSQHQDVKAMVKRGIGLFISGYLLNFFRSLLPLLLCGNIDEWTSMSAFFVVDIFQFAGLSFMFMALLKKLKMSNGAIFLVAIAMVILDQLVMLPKTVPWKSEFVTGIVNLFCPVSEWSCFPLLTWFIFPAFGLVFGQLLQHCTDKNKLYGILLPFGSCGIMYLYYSFYRLYPEYTSYYWGNNFYYMGLKNVLITLLCICFFLAFWFFVGKVLPDFLQRQLNFLSRNLNTYYVVSWLAISFLMHVQAIYKWQCGNVATIAIMVILIFLCAKITKLWLLLRGDEGKRGLRVEG